MAAQIDPVVRFVHESGPRLKRLLRPGAGVRSCDVERVNSTRRNDRQAAQALRRD